MEVDDREATDSGSLSGNPELDSSSTGGDSFVRGDSGVHGSLNMNISMEMNAPAAVTNAPAVTAGCGVIDGVVDIGSAELRTRGQGDSATGKKKRGRPRKYDAEGNLIPSYIKTSPVGFVSPAALSYGIPSGQKRGRGRPPGSGNWQILASLGDLFVNSGGGNFTPHVVTVEAGEDVAGKILTFAQKGYQGICVLSANGPVSNVTLRQPGASGGLLTYEGRFEILTLTGSYTVSETSGIKSRSGGLSVSLASSDGRVIGGGVAGMLTAASPIQIVVGSFVPNGFKFPKRKAPADPGVSPAAPRPMAAVTAATPISQAPPQSGSGTILNLSNSASADWKGPAPHAPVPHHQSPDINIPMPAEDQ